MQQRRQNVLKIQPRLTFAREGGGEGRSPHLARFAGEGDGGGGGDANKMREKTTSVSPLHAREERRGSTIEMRGESRKGGGGGGKSTSSSLLHTREVAVAKCKGGLRGA
jgi:hypothetical protein